jgi:acetyl-CoA carboxylase biotin carboxyl carrier protein
MEYSKLLELIKTVSDSNISNFQYEEGNTKIHMSSGDMFCESLPKTIQNTSKEDNLLYVNEDTMELSNEFDKKIVKSPLVGVFYSAPSEEARPFVNIGDTVKVGQTLAIVEAMKLMNDIESDYDGVVKKILFKNGDAVEYGQPLFVIE